MNELEYVISHFSEHFASYRGKRILLHGSRTYAAAIIDHFDDEYHFLGVMTQEELPEQTFCGKRIFTVDELSDTDPEVIILTERVKYEVSAWQELQEYTENNNVILRNMYGLDISHICQEYQCSNLLSKAERTALVKKADMIGFEVMDTFLTVRGDEIGRPVSQALQLFTEAQQQEKTLFFSLRRSYDEQKQREALAAAGIEESEKILILKREGEDLSFRILREKYPEQTILYFGGGLENEFLLPRYYGIDSVHLSYSVSSSLDAILAHTRETPASAHALDAAAAYRHIDAAEVVSFDIFDTLLVRKVLQPHDVICLMAAELPFVSDARRERFMQLRCQVNQDNRTLLDIYEEVLGMLPPEGFLPSQMVERELAMEKKLSGRREAVCALLEYAVTQGKTVVLTSDMYLTADQLQHLLKAQGIEGYQQIFVSVEHRCTKMNGLFEEVCRAYPGKQILHFGDDLQADIRAAQQSGIEAFFLPSWLYKACRCGYEEILQQDLSLTERCLIAICLSEAFEDPFSAEHNGELTDEQRLRRFAAAACTPLMIGFLCALTKEAIRLQKILFAARDGYLLEKLYQVLRAVSSEELPEGMYFLTSRHAAFQTCMDDVRTIHQTYIGRVQSPADLLRNVYGIEVQQDVAALPKEEAVRQYWPQIREKAEIYRDNYASYLQRCGLHSGNHCLFIDFVAIGTTQEYLQSFCDLNLKGWYMSCPYYGMPCTDISYYLTEPDSFFTANYMEMEYIMTSPDPSLDHFDEEGEPVYAEEVRSPEQLQRIAVVQETILRLGNEFFTRFYSADSQIRPIIAERMYAAEGYHGIINERSYDDWIKQKI